MRSKGEALRKRILLNHARKMAKLKKRFRDIRRRKNKARNGKNKAKQIAERINRQFEGYKKIVAPAIFSLTENTEETLQFIAKLEDCLEAKKKVFVNLTKVERIGCYCCSFVYYDKI